MPKLSIIMPVYNAAKYLRECLDSVLAQTYRNFEVICVDDGSTDGSLEMLGEYEKKLQSSTSTSNLDFKVIPCEHTNAGHCRNVGIANSSGEYLMFLDADDLFAPGLLESLLSAALTTNADVAVCEHIDFNDGDDTACLFPRTKTLAPKAYREPSKRADIFQWQGWPWDKLIARRIIDKYALSFQEQRTTNDVFFMMSALSVAETIVECPTPLMAHRRNILGSLSATRNKSPLCFRDALIGYYDKMCEIGIFPGNEKLLNDFHIYSCDQSFYQLDTVATSDAARSIFPILKELSKRWHWCEVLARDGKHPLLLQRSQSLAQANDVLDLYRSDAIALQKCFAELDNIKKSHTYRFAQFLVKLIRWTRT